MMQSRALRIFFLVATFAFANVVQAQWIQTNGPYGGYIQSFAVSGTNLFAGTRFGGVFHSTNNGTSWTAVNTGLPINNDHVYALAVKDTNLFAAIEGGGVFLSTNNGISWNAVNNGLPFPSVYALAVKGTNLFAGTGGGVFLSINNGTSWSAVNNGLTNRIVVAFAVKDTILFAGTQGGGVFRSINNGARWDSVSNGLTNRIVVAFAVKDTILFAATESGGVFRSTNNGISWSVMNNGLTFLYVNALAVKDTILFAGTGGGIFRSTNNGTSWSVVNNGLTFLIVYTLAVKGANLFAGTFGGVFLSINNGTSWGAVNNGLTNSAVFAFIVKDTILFAGTGTGGPFRSTNNGTSWSPVNIGVTNIDVYSFALNSTHLFAGTNIGVFRSTDSGISWNMVNMGLTTIDVRNFAVKVTNLFVGTSGGVFRSTNNGTNWSAVNNGLTNTSVATLAVKDTILFAGTRGGGVFRTINNGARWDSVSTSLTHRYVDAFAVKDTILFAGTGGGVFRTTNNGARWDSVSTGLTNRLVQALAVKDANLFAGTEGGGVFLSINNGTSWSAVNTDLTNTSVFALAVKDTHLFAGTFGGGVWRRPLSQIIRPLFSVAPPQVNFRNTIVASTSIDSSVVVTNTGTAALVISSVTSSDPQFIPTPVPVIPPGGTRRVTISFMPTPPSGLKTSTITFNHNATGSPSTITASGFAFDQLVWQGTTNTAWDTASNWTRNGTPGAIPAATDSVFIPRGATNNPRIRFGTNVVGALGIDSTRILTLLPFASLVVNTNLFVGNSSTFLIQSSAADSIGSNVIINGTVRVDSPAVIKSNRSWIRGPSSLFIPGPSTVPFSGIGTFSGNFNSVRIELGSVMTSDSSITVSNQCEVLNRINLRRQDMLVIQNADTSGLVGSGRVDSGTIKRRINPNLVAKRYRFESDNTYLQFLATGSYPDTVAITTYPNQQINYNRLGDSLGGVVNTTTHTIRLDNFLPRTDKYIIARPPPTTSSPAIDTLAVRRAYRIIIHGNQSFNATLSLRYDLSEVPRGVVESSLRLYLVDTVFTNAVHEEPENVETYSLYQNYPNPFNPTTTINYQLPVESRVTIKIYNILGQEINTMVDELQHVGNKTVVWNGKNNAGSQVSSGVYFYRLEAKSAGVNGKHFMQVKKMLLIR